MQTKARPVTAKTTADKLADPDVQAANQSTSDAVVQEQTKKDNTAKKRSARGNKNKKPAQDGKDGPQEIRYKQKTTSEKDATPVKQEKKSKHEKDDDVADQKQSDSGDSQQPSKRQRQRKNNQESHNRPKSQNSEAATSPEDGTEGAQAGQNKVEAEKKKGGNSGAQETKNLIYQNPMEFKETRKFKSKWEEYRLGDWRKGSGKTFVTLETKIPPLPQKLLSAPNEAAFQKKQAEIDDKIKSIGLDLEDKKCEFDGKLKQKIDAQKAGEGVTIVSKDIPSNFQRLGELKRQRKKIYDEQDSVAKIIAELNSQRDRLSKKIDKDTQKEEHISKAVKQIQRAMETQTLDPSKERQLIAKIKFIKASVEFIRERETIDEKLLIRNEEKKKIVTDLPRIKKEIKELSEVVEQQKKQRDEKQENRESLDKELDKINERRKRARDERDKLYQQKFEQKDEYYDALITYQKQQYLIKDIKWMTEMQANLRQKQEKKEKREKEQKERQERIQKEKEERARKEEERKEREQERKQRELENQKLMEEQLQQDEIDTLHKIIASIENKTIESNPFLEQIELCDKLSKFCQKQNARANAQAAPHEDADVAKKGKNDSDRANNNDLTKAFANGSVQLAPTKESRDVSGYVSLQGRKGKKGKRNTISADTSGQINFSMIKQFASLKVSPPIGDDAYEPTVQALKELSNALDYWGNILQRQKKIRHIRTSKKLKDLEEYNKIADQEEEWLKNEKQRFENAGDDVECSGTKISLAKLKIAQAIDKELRLNYSWKDDDDQDGEDESDEDRGYTIDDMGDEENPREEPIQKKERKTRGQGDSRKVKQAQKPNPQKFKEIMKADEEAFPTLDNQSDEDAVSMNIDDNGVAPDGEIAA